MARPREVRDCFQDLIDQNNQTITEIGRIQADLKTKEGIAAQAYDENIDTFIDSLLEKMDGGKLAKLSKALNNGTDYPELYRDLQKRSAKTADLLDKTDPRKRHPPSDSGRDLCS
jgi:hypothetical protein